MHLIKMEDNPLVSIITVVRNGENTLENTIRSVLSQQEINYEYIVIDGNSQDTTLDIIKNYEKFIDIWISEPDRGIYDAMNKGISYASGDFVVFMNAGDQFATQNICSNIFTFYDDEVQSIDVIYGDFIAKDENTGMQLLVKAKPIENIWKGMTFSHQSVFIRTSVLKKYPFDLKYRIVSDFNQIINIYMDNYKFHYFPQPFSLVTISGLSYSNIYTTLEQIRVVKSNKPFSLKVLYFILKLFIDLIRAGLGTHCITQLRKFKWRYLIKLKSLFIFL